MQSLNKLLAPYKVQLHRHRGKTLRMRAKADEQLLLLSAPWFVTQREIERYVHDNIEKIRAHITQHQQAIETKQTRIARVNQAVFTREVAVLMSDWSAKLGLKPPAFFLRSMRSRWGSCTPKTQRIRINIELRFHPFYALEYVVVHELIHIFEPSHNARFYALLNTHLPNWQEGHQYLRLQRLV